MLPTQKYSAIKQHSYWLGGIRKHISRWRSIAVKMFKNENCKKDVDPSPDRNVLKENADIKRSTYHTMHTQDLAEGWVLEHFVSLVK